MLQGKRTRRTIAATLLIILLTNTLAPTVSYALTSGPTAPEATSFEPVDTTDMVNLQTGDLTYNVPLLEVPGPEGSYPLALSYHAGIQPNEDASWVGLGWSLNPGAITRNVNGYPDDWYNPSNSTHTYWSGGTVHQYSIGLTIGVANTSATATFGLSFSQDTYRGFGGGFYMGLGVAMGYGPFKANLGLGISTNSDDLHVNGSIGLGTGPIAAVGANFNTNFRSVSTGFSYSLLGHTISTSSDGTKSFSSGGFSASVSSSKEAGIQTSTSGFGFMIPIDGIYISLGYSKTRYWTDEQTNVNAHGSLYASGWPVTDNVAYDTYGLLEDPGVKSIVDYPDPTTLQGGAYMDFDGYNVNAQGMSGNMRPYLFQGEILGQNRKNTSNAPLVTYYSPGSNHPQPQFRFVGDFSNSYRQGYQGYSLLIADLLTATPPFETPVFGEQDGTYGFSGNKLAGSKDIEVGVKVKPTNITGYNEADRYKSGMINGFSITNASGVTYHYGLPAYTWGEEKYQERISRTNGVSLNRGTKPEAYAYTWYLTSITGSDFVDRNGDQKAGAGDWGYWLNFEYGKWSNNYVWRNPGEGYHADEDASFQNCSMGRKEIYYLNAIRSRSHIALFEKDIRLDGKGSSPAVYDKNSPNNDYANAGIFDINSSQSLKLSKIYLLNITDANAVSSSSGNSNAYKPSGTRSIACSDCELATNVLDKTDVDAAGRNNLEAKAIRVIDFVYDYSLCDKTVNSYDINNSTIKSGKLTLNQLITRGKGGINLMPPTKFEYELTGDDRKSGQVTFRPGQFFTTTNSAFENGDLIVIEGSPDLYSGVISDKSFNGSVYTFVARGIVPWGMTQATIHTTKNPPYDKDKYDRWGLYKTDTHVGSLMYNENQARITSENSSKSTDAWSLRKIITPLGAEIKITYESDSYGQSVLVRNHSFVAYQLGSVGPTDIEYILYTDALGGYSISDIFKPGDKVDFIATQGAAYYPNSNSPSQPVLRVLDSRNFSSPVTIQSANPNFTITLHCDAFPSVLHTDRNGYFFENGIQAPTIGPMIYESGTPRWLNISVRKDGNIPGGGLRVKSISSINTTDGRIVSTIYDYNKPNSDQTSGVTAYEPGGLNKSPFEPPYTGNPWMHIIKSYKRALYKDLNALYAISRELPPPGVMYEFVTVRTEVKNAGEALARSVEGKTQYQFEVFRDNMVGREQLGGWQDSNEKTANMVIKKFNANIGNVKRIIQYDKDNRKLGETINHYLHDGLENLSFADFMTQYKNRLEVPYKYQGFIQERYSEVKQVSNQENTADNGIRATLSAREEYPSIQTGQTVINYVNGTQATSQNLAYDFYSGAIVRSAETDVYGNRFMTEVIPAYRKYSALGLRTDASSNKNMLSQTAGTYTYKTDANNMAIGVVSANVTTWNNNANTIDANGSVLVQNGGLNGNVWRPQSSYGWLPDTKTTDGLTAVGNFTNFNWAVPGSSHANWKKVSEITLYDVYSKALEVTDVNNNYAATRMGYNGTRVIVSGGPGRYSEIAFSGAEDNLVNGKFGGGVSPGNGDVLGATGHTGERMLYVGSGQNGFTYAVNLTEIDRTKDYIAHVWSRNIYATVVPASQLIARKDGVAIGTAVVNSAKKSGNSGWYLLSLLIKKEDLATGTSLEVFCKNAGTGTIYFDDFRFQPANASTMAYVYDQLSGELTYMLTNNNLFVKYEYDVAGKLKKTFGESFANGQFVAAEYEYNYGRDGATATAYNNVEKSKIFYRQGCAVTELSQQVVYTVPANKYKSYVSQADADAKAQFDIDTKGQQYANVNGRCKPIIIYAKIVVTNVQRPPGGHILDEAGDVYLRLFADNDCTIPLELVAGVNLLSPVRIHYRKTTTPNGGSATDNDYYIDITQYSEDAPVLLNAVNANIGPVKICTGSTQNPVCTLYSYKTLSGVGYLNKE